MILHLLLASSLRSIDTQVDCTLGKRPYNSNFHRILVNTRIIKLSISHSTLSRVNTPFGHRSHTQIITRHISITTNRLSLMIAARFLLCSALLSVASAFTLPVVRTTMTSAPVLGMAGGNQQDEDFMRWARASRTASSDDNVVELSRPLGLVLNQDDKGNVFVETVAPKGNAARTGKVKEGDIVTMCSATFGEDMWSTRGVGLTRVLAAIRVRSGPTVKLVFESPKQYQKKAANTTAQRKAAEDARIAAQQKKDDLLAQLEQDEQKLKNKKFFGLF